MDWTLPAFPEYEKRGGKRQNAVNLFISSKVKTPKAYIDPQIDSHSLKFWVLNETGHLPSGSELSIGSKMEMESWFLLMVVVLLSPILAFSEAVKVKTAVFQSPKFVLGPGSVENRYYYNIDFPRGHIALKSFDAEVVDEEGNAIPLSETYLHHWVVMRYYTRKDAGTLESNKSDHFFVRNDGVCQNLGQYFGLGSETRKTSTHVPDPYGIEVGNPAVIPDGYEELWMLNVHAIDTRGAEDSLGCIECRCDLYNVTIDDYKGGLKCCYDQTQCKIKDGFQDVRRSLYLRYTVKYVEWDSSIIPVKIYIFDVTDSWTKTNPVHHCKVEYEVNSVIPDAEDEHVHYQRATVTIPASGYVVYGVAHQHTGGVGSTLSREGGEAICTSIPVYGEGKEPGNEAGYIVGMSTCYPSPGTIKISDGEILTVESRYSRARNHTGVMGLFYILVSDQLPQSKPTTQSLVHANVVEKSTYLVSGVALLALALVAGVIVRDRLRREREDGYEAIVM